MFTANPLTGLRGETVIDATVGVTDQDQRIARMAFERGKGVVVVLHKWDLITHDKQRARATAGAA